MVNVLIDGYDRTCETAPPVTITVGRRTARDNGAPQYARLTLTGPPPAPRLVDTATWRVHAAALTPAGDGLADLTGNGRDMAFAGGPTVGTMPDGTPTVNFSGNNGQRATATAALPVPRTIMVWATLAENPDGTPYDVIVGNSTGNTAEGWMLCLRAPDQLHARTDMGGGNRRLTTESSGAALGRHVFTMLQTEEHTKLFYDGTLVRYVTNPPGLPAQGAGALSIGALSTGAYSIHGLDLHAAATWDRELTDPEIAAAAAELADPSVPPPTVLTATGQRVSVADGGARHTGRITDIGLTHDEHGAVQDIISTGALAVWGRARIGDEPWPQESVAERAARIAALVGLPVVVEGGADLQVIGRDVDSQPGIRVLTDLADSTGGWLWDDADGIVHLQALDARKVGSTTVLWSQEPAAATWADLDGTTWDGDDAPGPYMPVNLQCHDIGWEPVWKQTLEFVNKVTVKWGPAPSEGEQAQVTVTDPDSIADLGESSVTITSSLAEEGDALELAGLILTRSSRPRWNLGQVDVDFADLDPGTAAALLNAAPGTRITVNGLPQPAPHGTAFPGVLEGWAETIGAGGGRAMTLWLSHIEESLALPTWDAEPPTAPWTAATTTWEDDLT